MKLSLILRQGATRWVAWIMAAAMISTGAGPTWGADICTEADLADVPLMLMAGKGPPAMLMIAFDRSNSMWYEVMTNDSDRSFHAPGGAPYNFLYTGNSGAIEGVAADKNAWKSQCSQYNKMYYNPEVGNHDGYQPWPLKSDVNVDTPLWNPQDAAGGTYDLTQNWASLTTAAVTSTVKNQEVNGGTWELLASNITFTSSSGKVSVYHTVTSANAGAGSDEFFADAIKFHCSAEGHTVIVDSHQNDSNGKCVLTGPAGGWVYIEKSDAEGRWGHLTESVGDYTATWSTTVLRADKTYDVYAKWDDNNERSNNIRYDVISPGSTANIKRRHFYMEGGEGLNRFPYLINLVNADTAEFYKVFDTSTPDKVENYDLISVAYDSLPQNIKNILPEPATGAYSTHLQNFANWFTYNRRRIYSVQNAVAMMVDRTSNMMIGMQTVPPSSQTGKTGIMWIDVNFDGQHFDYTNDFLNNILYQFPNPSSENPFTDDINAIGGYFAGATTIINASDILLVKDPLGTGLVSYTDSGPGNPYPYFSQDYGGQCQQAFLLVITDGVSTGGGTIKNFDRGTPPDSGGGGVPDVDSIYDGGVFGDEYSNTAADAAMRYYEQDLKPDCLTNEVPTNYIDYARHQHMVMYALSLGVQGDLQQQYPHFDALCADINNDNACICAGGCPTWGNMVYHSSKNPNPMSPIDDLWHATVNSRGLFFYADNPQQLIEELMKIVADIERRQGAAAAVTTNSVQRQVGTIIYQGLYNSDGWYGDILAKNVDVATGVIGTTKWSAMDMLDGNADKGISERDYATRKILASDGNNAAAITAGSAYSFGTLSFNADQVKFIMGDRSNEGTLFRVRKSKLGDIVHSEPFVFDDVVYIGANDGMMHAFNADTGAELFGYIPSRVIDKLPRLWDPDHEHSYYVDATPHIFSFGTGTPTKYLAGGLGKGGKGVYCLDVTNAKNVNNAGFNLTSLFNWEFYVDSDADDDVPNGDDLGYVFGRVYSVPSTVGPAVIFGNGYASESGEAVLYVLDAEDGSIIKKFETGNTGSDGCNGLSTPYITDYYPDGIADLIYAGDLDGNLWKFDLSDNDPNNWNISYGGNPLFTARDATDRAQPITSEPVVIMHCDRFRSGTIVVFGTGQYLNEDDLSINVATQSIYGIYDWEADLILSEVDTDPSDKFLGEFQTGGGLSNLDTLNFPTSANPAILLEQSQVLDTVGGDGEVYRVTQDNETNYYNPYLDPDIDQGQTHAGWYYVLPDSSERVVRNPIIRAGVAIVVANTIESGMCSGGGGAWLYMLDACSGGRPDRPQFDTDGDGDFDADDTVTSGEEEVRPSAQRFETFLFDPLGTPDKLYINDTFGNILEHDIPEDKAGLFYWRLIE